MILKYFLFKPLINCSDTQFARFQQEIDGHSLLDGSKLEVVGGRPGMYFVLERRTPARTSVSSPTQEELSTVVAAARLVAVRQGLPEDCPVMVVNRRSGLFDDEPTLLSIEQDIQARMSQYRQELVGVLALGCTRETVERADNCIRQMSGMLGLAEELRETGANVDVSGQVDLSRDRARHVAALMRAVDGISQRLAAIEETDRDLGLLIDRCQAGIDSSTLSPNRKTAWNRYREQTVMPQVQRFRADLDLALALERRLRNIVTSIPQENPINGGVRTGESLNDIINRIDAESAQQYRRFAAAAGQRTQAWCNGLEGDVRLMRSEFSRHVQATMAADLDRLVEISTNTREVRHRFDEVLAQLGEVSEVIGDSGPPRPVLISERRRQMDEKVSVFSRAASVARDHLSNAFALQSNTCATVGDFLADLVGRIEPIHHALAQSDGTPVVLPGEMVGQIGAVLAEAKRLSEEVRSSLQQAQDRQSRLAGLDLLAFSRSLGTAPDLRDSLDQAEQVAIAMDRILSVTTIALDEALDVQERIEHEASWAWIDSEHGGADLERVLDATAVLGMRGHGSWEQFVNACDIANRHGTTALLEPDQFSRVLRTIGSIEVDFDRSPSRWTVAPVTLLPLEGRSTSDLRAFGLFGLNAASKSESVASLIRDAQVSRIQQPRDVAPPVPLVTVPRGSSDGIGTDDRFQAIGVHVSSIRLGDLLPHISDFTQSLHLRRAFRPSRVESAREWTGDRWAQIEAQEIESRLEQGGLFSIEEEADRGTRSVVWGAAGADWWGGEWATLLHRAFLTDARRTSSARFYRSTDPNGPSNGGKTLRVKDTWRWPSLYERALVLTTGTLPGRSQNRILDYPAVDEAMAKHLCTLLGINFEVREEEN